MDADEPARLRKAIASQDRGGGINITWYDVDPYDKTSSGPKKTIRVGSAADIQPDDDLNEIVCFCGDLAAYHAELTQLVLRKTDTVEFNACSSAFVRSTLEGLDHPIRNLDFSHCWLDDFPSEFPTRLWSISMKHTWCGPGLLRGVKAAATTITLPEENPWYEDVIESSVNCFIVGDDGGLGAQLCKALSHRPPLRGLHISKVGLTQTQLHEVLNTGSARVSVQGMVTDFIEGPIPDATPGCVDLNIEQLEFESRAAVARCLRGRSTLKSISLPPVALDLALVEALAALPALSELSIQACRSIANGTASILPGVSTVHILERQSGRKAAIRAIFPNAEIMAR